MEKTATVRSFVIVIPQQIRSGRSRGIRWAGLAAWMGEKRVAYSVLVGKFTLRRPRRRWEDNIKMNFKEIVLGGHGLD